MAYGPSQIINKHIKDNLLLGIGQGSTDTPPGWTFNLDICTKCYDKTAHGFQITNPENIIQVECNTA
eukprot:1188289-Ditylum_brightwellii.AAC.1